MRLLQRICVLMLLFLCNNLILVSTDMVVLILSQESEYNSKMAEKLEQSIKQKTDKIHAVYLSHRDFNNNGDWTILPLLHEIFLIHYNEKWIFICDENTEINVNRLLQVLDKYNSTQEQWIGHALVDSLDTIMHHFNFYKDYTTFLHPNIPSGFAITMPLVEKLMKKFSIEKMQKNDIEFYTDASAEISLYILNNKTGPRLIHEPNFCIYKAQRCATFVRDSIRCGPPVPNNSVYFAVKTYHKFHENRLKVVKETWAKYIENIEYFSDITDTNIPTISLGIPNTENGHCAKQYAIINHANNVFQNNKLLKWFILVDDDTIISPYRLRKLLSCYKNSKYLALGHKYGFGVRTDPKRGLNFITGGAGTIFSKDLVRRITENKQFCSCPQIDSADDLYLGVCLLQLKVKIIHSHFFHQLRPQDYHPTTIPRNSISFHKYTGINPIQVYNTWFRKDDEKTFDDKSEL